MIKDEKKLLKNNVIMYGRKMIYSFFPKNTHPIIREHKEKSLAVAGFFFVM